MCILGFTVGPGRACTSEERARAAQLVNFLGGFISSPAFATGFLYEFVDSIAVTGLSSTSGIVEVILKDTQIGQRAAAHIGISLANCSIDPRTITTILSPYSSVVNNPDPYFQLGRATGRSMALAMALGQVTSGTGGTVLSVVGAAPSGGLTLAAAPATVAIAAHGGLVVGGVIAKELADPLLLRMGVLLSKAYDAAGGGGGGGGNFPTVPSPGSTTKIENLNGKNVGQARSRIESAGYQFHSQSSGGYIRFRHPDGSEVLIRPNGEIMRLGPKIQPNPNASAYHPRYDYQGHLLPPGAQHHTGEFVRR